MAVSPWTTWKERLSEPGSLPMKWDKADDRQKRLSRGCVEAGQTIHESRRIECLDQKQREEFGYRQPHGVASRSLQSKDLDSRKILVTSSVHPEFGVEGVDCFRLVGELA